MVAGKERRLNAAENDRAILEQLFALRWKSAHQLQAVAHAESQKLPVRAAHQPDDVKIAVCGHRASQKGEFRSRFAFEVENARRPGPHLEHGVKGVVFGDRFVGEGSRDHQQAIRAGQERWHPQSHPRDVATVGKANLLCGNDAPICLHRHGRLLSARAAHRDRRFDQHRRSRQHGRRRGDPLDGDIACEALLTDTHCVHRHAPCPEREERGTQIPAAVVRPVGDDDDAGEGHPRQILSRDVECTGEIGAASASGERCRPRRRPRVGREAEHAQREPGGKTTHQLTRVRKHPLHRGQPGRAIHVAQAHAARVVEQDGEHVPLIHGAGEHDSGPHQARQHDQDAHHPNRRQHGAIDSAHGPHLAVHRGDQRQCSECDQCDEQRRNDRGEHQVAALKDARRILEQEGKDRLERSSQTSPER